MFTDFDTEPAARLRIRANGTVEIETMTDLDIQLIELDYYTNDLWED